MNTNHNPFQLIFLLLNVCVVVITTLVVFTSLGLQYGFQEAIPNLLRHDLENISSAEPSPISPAPWFHPIWAAIFILQVLWSVYGVVSVFRKTAGVPVYTSPVLLSVTVLLFFIVACGFNIAWFILYDRKYTSTSCAFLFVSVVSGWISFFTATYHLASNVYRLRKSERRTEIYLVRLLVHNGMSAYAMWCWHVLCYNITVAAIHNSKIKLSPDVASIIGLSFIGAAQLTYLLVDVICLDRFTRYIVAPYIVTIPACLYRAHDWPSNAEDFILLISLLSFAFFSLMVKCLFITCRIVRPTSGGGEITFVSHTSPSTSEDRYLLKEK
ncbi:uncharacterized protein LOC131939619 [Physella acuta]|uniref:uncharacterized protein LOC131939619 n=1 Tax=Physella acuta TaxID=109671 RepID=UPI0027DC71E5|nr:uncharacterized protein LOC131939619 [Physella acuta]